MAAVQMGITTGFNEKEFIGTKAEQEAVVTTDLGPGSTYWATDEKKGYIWDGTAWQALS